MNFTLYGEFAVYIKKGIKIKHWTCFLIPCSEGVNFNLFEGRVRIDRIVFEIIAAGCALVGLINITMAFRKNSDLKHWWLAIFLVSSGFILSPVKNMIPEMYYLVLILDLVGILTACFAAVHDYRQAFPRESRKDPSLSMNMVAAISPGLTGSILSALFCTTTFCGFLLVRIYRKTKRPTHVFFALTLFFGAGASLGFLLEAMEMPYAEEISLSLVVVANVVNMLTAFVVNIDLRLTKAEQQAKADFDQLRANFETNQVISKELSEKAIVLSSIAEEVTASSQNVANSQQQIAKGAQNQASLVINTQKQIQGLNDSIKEVKRNAEEITEVVSLITSIASQTNLLALNAAIEAARAGDAGRGFSVVADQVRKLADESKQAVQRTEGMANQILKVSEQQSKDAIIAVEGIDNMASVAEETASSTEEASAAAEEQAASMEQISSTAQLLAELAGRLQTKGSNPPPSKKA